MFFVLLGFHRAVQKSAALLKKLNMNSTKPTRPLHAIWRPSKRHKRMAYRLDLPGLIFEAYLTQQGKENELYWLLECPTLQFQQQLRNIDSRSVFDAAEREICKRIAKQQLDLERIYYRLKDRDFDTLIFSSQNHYHA